MIKRMHALALFRPLGVDLFCLGKKFLVYNLVSRNLKIKYHRSAIGLFWTFLSPLSSALVFYFVFKIVLNVGIPHYLAFILAGVLPWAFFNQTIFEGMESIIGNLGLISKVPIPTQVFPFVGALTNLVTLTLAIPIIIGAAVFSGVHLGSSLIFVPFYFLCLFFIAYGFSLCLAILLILFRDLRHVMGIVMQLWFYGTPIVYQETMIPAKYQWILSFNPIAYIFIDLHRIFVSGECPPLHNSLIAWGWAFFALFMATLVCKLLGNDLVERI